MATDATTDEVTLPRFELEQLLSALLEECPSRPHFRFAARFDDLAEKLIGRRPYEEDLETDGMDRPRL